VPSLVGALQGLVGTEFPLSALSELSVVFFLDWNLCTQLTVKSSGNFREFNT
jgi:hypothetical protein